MLKDKKIEELSEELEASEHLLHVSRLQLAEKKELNRMLARQMKDMIEDMEAADDVSEPAVSEASTASLSFCSTKIILFFPVRIIREVLLFILLIQSS